MPVVFVGFQSSLNFLHRVSRKAQISNFIKIRVLGAELFHANRQTDVRKDGHEEASHNFVNAHKDYIKKTKVGLRDPVIQPLYFFNPLVFI
jgi:hypothetical protein